MGSQREYFNEVAYKWDKMCVHDTGKIEKILNMVEIKDGDSVLDAGCGTGVLVPFLMKRVGRGNITCLDISEKMIEVAKGKYPHKGVKYIVGDIYEHNTRGCYDVIMLYSCYPHFEDKKALMEKILFLLKDGGKVCICHSQSRDEINNMHKSREEVSKDILPEGSVTSSLMIKAGLKVKYTIDNDDMYMVLGAKE